MKIVDGVSVGQRNNCGIKLCRYLLERFENDTEKTFSALSKWNRRNRPPLENRELLNILKCSLSQPYVSYLI